MGTTNKAFAKQVEKLVLELGGNRAGKYLYAPAPLGMIGVGMWSDNSGCSLWFTKPTPEIKAALREDPLFCPHTGQWLFRYDKGLTPKEKLDILRERLTRNFSVQD